MSILIKGMEMPFEHPVLFCIHPDGKVFADMEGSWREYKAAPVPPHGDLIDRDALKKDISESVVFSGRDKTEIYGANKIINRLHHAPTVIEADRGDDQ